ncbi:TetR/AcrR family transcriptional regulator [Propionibacteriaceae bacterium Y2011]|uniref:TetR/AcrR family transcriptional regulator n=1 Tax=Microlunatus sp. Y2014 TaxID=3418488 RepID=UPI003B469793
MPPVTTASPNARRTAGNPDDPRYRRTRALLCTAARQLLADGDTRRLTFARVAELAEVNRSTVHQHYGSVPELVADALSAELVDITRPIASCPFADGTTTPAELRDMFAAAHAWWPTLTRLDATGAALVARRLGALLTEQLVARFATGRPPGFDAVPTDVHAHYVATGLVALLLDGDGSPEQRADHAWLLLAPTSSTRSRPGGRG